MIYNRISALKNLKPSTQWIWTGTDYSGLNWLDSGSAPTESDLRPGELTVASKNSGLTLVGSSPGFLPLRFGRVQNAHAASLCVPALRTRTRDHG